MRIAVIDLTFHWPSSGGSWIDLYEIMTRLQNRGHDVTMFTPKFQWGIVPRGEIKDPLPFPVQTIPFRRRNFNFYNAPRRFRDEILRYNPDIIYIGDAYTLKPYMGLIFPDYPVIQRFFGHELMCPNYIGLTVNNKICDIHYLRTPLFCTQCASKEMYQRYRKHGMDEFIHEFILGLGFLPTYLHTVKKALRKASAIVVSNQWTKDQFSSYNSHIHIIPGGVNIDIFHPADISQKQESNRKKIIFMPGRVYDPRKGLDVLKKAVARLSKERQDFRVLITDTHTNTDGVIQSTGWKNREEIAQLYRESDICVAPVLWHEPFGLVAVEAMASGIPVIASDVGGFKGTVREGITGYRIPMGDDIALAKKIAYLLDHPDEGKRMGLVGRKIVEDEYTWDKIVDTHYITLFESVVKKATV